METAGGAALGYPDSVDSSPRSRGGDSWDEPFPSSAAATTAAAAGVPSKLRLMCSFGGRIVPRPTDKSLCYLGGETRIVVVDRHSTLSDLSAKLSRSLLGGSPFSLKYQLPNEDLDSLISVSTDEDLDNMIEEYDRLLNGSSTAPGNPTPIAASGGGGGSSRSNRLRLFLFASKPESAPSSIGSLLDDSKSETWFVDALNGAMGIGIDDLPRGMSTDSASVNCLLGLEDDSSVHSRTGRATASDAARSESEQMSLTRPDSSGKLARHGQDVHSVPDSPMLETTSSFGSTSSAPSLSNLPPIRVRPDDRPPDIRYNAIDDHFSQMNLAGGAAGERQRQEEGFVKDPNFVTHHVAAAPPLIPLPTANSSTPTISPTENPTRVFSDDEKSDHGGARKPPKPTPLDAPNSDSAARPIYYDRLPSLAAAGIPIQDQKRELPVSEPTYRMPPPPEAGGYMFPPEQLQQIPHSHPHPHQQQQQQQYIPTGTHYIHPATGQVVPINSYYPQVPHPIQQSQQPHYDQQIPMYYLPVRQNPPPVKNEMPQPTNLYRTAAAPAPVVHVAAAPDQSHGYAGMNYHVMHHHHPSQSPAAAMTANYGYEYVSDPAHAAPQQVYYTQTTSPPVMQPQYQTVVSSAGMMVPDVQPGEMKQNRQS